MPGKQGNLHWFQNEFGFKETEPGSFKEVAARFNFNDGKLESHTNNRSFHVGLFETPSCEELRERLRARNFETPSCEELRERVTIDPELNLGGLTFENISDNVTTLHMDGKNAGSVFMVASQFNCLEMVGPGTRPEDGVTRYAVDDTQGPKCALAAPAATVFRNYLYSGRGQAGGSKCQIDNSADIGDLLNNKDGEYWNMQNGYLLPSAHGSIKRAAEKIKTESLQDSIRARLRVGIHWDTEVRASRTPGSSSSTPSRTPGSSSSTPSRTPGSSSSAPPSRTPGSSSSTPPHRVCQVFCSALPLSYSKSTRVQDWSVLARPILDGAFESCLLAGAVIARREGRRVKVFLTGLGAGAFGNPSIWVADALERALKCMLVHPLDVRLVHYHRQPNQRYKHIQQTVKELQKTGEK